MEDVGAQRIGTAVFFLQLNFLHILYRSHRAKPHDSQLKIFRSNDDGISVHTQNCPHLTVYKTIVKINPVNQTQLIQHLHIFINSRQHQGSPLLQFKLDEFHILQHFFKHTGHGRKLVIIGDDSKNTLLLTVPGGIL